MIASAADYRFVDFATGSLPTDRFDGGVMPLRPAAAQTQGVLTQDAMKAEDIAFLHEGIRDKIGAMMGATIGGRQVDEHVHPGTSSVPRSSISSGYPAAIPLVKSISSRQMVDFCRYLRGAALSGETGVRFLETSLAEIPTSWSDSSGLYPMRSRLPSVATGVSPLKADEANFAVGQPWAKRPILDLFDSMKLFARPIWFTGDLFSRLDDSCFSVTGRGPDYMKPTVGKTLAYMMQSSSDPDMTYNDYVWRNIMNTTEILAIPLDFIKDPVRLWMRFGAYNQLVDSSGFRMDAFTGMIDVTGFFNPIDGNGMRHYATTPADSLRLMRHIEGLRGWEEYSPSPSGSYRRQYLNVAYTNDFIVEFTPSGRTQWW